MSTSHRSRIRSDALVLFGATGISPTDDLSRPLCDGEAMTLAVPVIGVARSNWDLERFRRGPRQHPQEPAGSTTSRPCRLISLLGTSTATTTTPARSPRSRSARRRAAPGALPRDPAVTLRDRDRGARQRGPAQTARVSSSRSRSGATSPRRGAEPLRAVGVPRGFDLPDDHFLGKEGS